MKTCLQFFSVLFLMALLVSATKVSGQANTSTEFTFKNAVLQSGEPNQDGAVYLFRNVAAGIDATVTIVERSSPAVILDTIDIAPGGGMGFDKALQPQLGLHGNAPGYSKWWMRFKVNFLKAGTDKPATIDRFSASALDIDGDNVSIAENITMDQAISETISPSSVLTTLLPAALFCPREHLPSLAIPCLECLGLGYKIKHDGKTEDCSRCKNTGKVYALCGHPWTGSDIYRAGTIVNAAGIDTLALNNMVTFNYVNTDEISFVYGASMGAASSTAAERLNSMYFKSFNYSLFQLLPLQLVSFAAVVNQSAVNLTWSTTAEVNFNGFIVERSADGKTYTDLTTLAAKGKTAGRSEYNYPDMLTDDAANTLYYRLKMIDKSGGISYSPVQVIRLAQTKNSVAVSVFPNPASDQLVVTLPAAWQGNKVSADVYNASGIRVKSLLYASANLNERIDIAQLEKGMYVLMVTSNNSKMQTKILKN